LPDRPADLVDGDDDALAALECAPGELASWDGADWACTSDATLSAEDVRAIVVSAPLDLSVGTTVGGEPLSGGPVLWGDVRDVPADLVDGDADTLGGLDCDSGEVARFDGAAWACAPDGVGVLPEEVAGLVPLDLPAETTFGGVAPVLGAVAWSDLTGRPADLLDGDDDLLADVSCAPGEALFWDGVAWDCYAPVESDRLAELGLLCEDGQIPVYEAFEGSWSCADDQVLASDEVLAIVDDADLDLGPGTTLDGAALLTVGGGIPAELLPFDGLEAVSNGVLSNRFITRVFAAGIAIPDNFPSGVASELVVPPVGTAADVRVSVDLLNSNIAGLTLELVAPDGTENLLYDGDGEGEFLTATYPDPDRPVSGDLNAWDGGDPSGTWTLTVIDSDYLNNTFDGEVVEWAIEVDAYSDDSVRIGGALVVKDNLSVDADLSVAGDLSVDGTLSLANPVDLPVGSTLGGRPLVDADNAALLAPNLLLNGGVDLWQRGDAAMPDGWYPSGALDYSRVVADGREYGSVTAAAADEFVFQKLEAPGDWAGLPLTFAIDVAGEVGARVEVDDGVSVTSEDVPPGEGWQRIVLQHVVDPAADRVAVKLVPGVAGALAFDRATLAAGTWASLPHVPRDPYAELRRAERLYEIGRGSLYSDDAVENPVETWWFDFRTPKADMPEIAFEVDNASGRPEYYSMRVSVVTTRGWYYDQENEDAEAGGAYDYHLTLDWTAEVPVSW
jgi:subtilisin-like proprotein convertase family protein